MAAAFIYGVRHTLVIILFAIFFAYLLEPLVYRVQNSKLSRGSRWLAICESYIGIGIIIAVLFTMFGGQLVQDAQHLTQALPNLVENVSSGKIVWQFGNKHGWSAETQHAIEQFIAAHQATILSWTGRLGAEAAKSLQNVVWVVLIPILAIFFLRDGRQFAETFLCAFDQERHRRLLRGIVNDLDQVLAHFIRAQLILAGAATLAYCSVFSIMRLPYALVLGVAAGIMEFIPIVGPLAAAIVILSVSFLLAYPHILLLLVFFGVWRLIQDYVISPRVMGGSLQLHPLAAIVAVLMGNELGGVLGVYLSIPFAAAIRIIWRRWQKYSAVQALAPQQAATEPLRPATPTIVKR